MSEKSNIPIRNIYYMLAYALDERVKYGGCKNVDNVDKEEFEHIHDLFAWMLSGGVSRLIKQGLYREYSEYGEALPVLRGRLDINNTMREMIARRRRLFCNFDELTCDILPNRILKSAMCLLACHEDVKDEYKDHLKKQLFYFSGVSDIHLSQVNWSMVHLHRNNRHYRWLIKICYFLAASMLQNKDEGKNKLADFPKDSEMCHLYESFLRSYFKCHHPELKPKRNNIEWNFKHTDGNDDILPKMQTDVVLHYGNRELIIDAKFKEKILASNEGGKEKLEPQNLYQIFSYVKNEEYKGRENVLQVDGMLLYAQTVEEKIDAVYQWGNNKFYVKTLNLNKPFKDIAASLDKIANDFMNQS